MSALAALYDKAFEALELAVEADKDAGDQAFALKKYDVSRDRQRIEALRLFEAVQAQEGDGRKKALLTTKLEEMGDRRLQLREIVASQTVEAAIDLDEQGRASDASDKYVEAIGMYLETIKLHEDKKDAGSVAHLRKRVGQILDHVEEMKGISQRPSPGPTTPTPTPTPPKAAGPELERPPPTAPPPTQASRPSVSPSRTNRGSSGAAGGGSPAPAPRGGLSDAEIDVLRRSSVINGKTFMPWLEGEEHHERFKFDEPFADPEGILALSPKQQSKLAGWKRPSQFITGAQPQMIKVISPFSIEQELVSDCSFVASLCISSAFEKRFRKQLITRIIFPQDRNGIPLYNPHGKYMVKLWANGVARKVIVDDLLPVDRYGRLLCSCSEDKSELWVSIVEKAYMKLNGGYDFPGSNSGIDLFALTGWIPEQIHFEEDGPRGRRESRSGSGVGQPLILDHRQPAEKAWERMLSAHKYGDCLITVATSQMEDDEAEAMGLVPTHAYAVLDVKEVGAVRLLLVKNPWAHKRWTGSYSASDTPRWTSELRSALKYDPAAALRTDDGVFWIDWTSIRRYFNTIFLNWNPSLFTYRTVLHATWPAAQGPKNDSYTVGQNPQYSLIVSKPPGARSSPTVWILLSRHVLTKESTSQAGDYLTLHVFKKQGGQRVYYPSEDNFFRGVYSNNPHTLVRFDLEGDDPGHYTLVLSQYEKTRDVSYTLNVYCTSAFRISVTPPTPPIQKSLQGCWDAASAGGRLGLPTFILNPQYSLAINRRMPLHVELMAPKEYFVNISVVGGVKGGKRVDAIMHGEEVGSSGDYRSGFCLCSLEAVDPGVYTIIVSTYNANCLGNFIVNIHSPGPFQHIKPILPEGDGMTRQVVSGNWLESDSTAAGCNNYGAYLYNPTFQLTVDCRTKLLFRLFCQEREAINVTLYRPTNDASSSSLSGLSLSTGPKSEHALATSCQGVYMDNRCGVATPPVDVDAGTYYVIISTFDPRSASFSLTVFSSPKQVRIQRLR